MAERKSGKVSRRQAMTLLSTGAIASAIGGGVSAKAHGEMDQQSQAPDCSKAIVPLEGDVTIKGVPKKAIYGYGNCECSANALRAGIAALGAIHPTANPASKHLGQMIEAVDKYKSQDEYCFIAFGLDKKTVDKLTEQAKSILIK